VPSLPVAVAPPPIPAPVEIAAPRTAPAAQKEAQEKTEQDKGVFSLVRIPHWMRPEPAPAGDAPRPPMPVGEAAQQ
jgi:hypothetical protein